MDAFTIYADQSRHVVTIPYNRENLLLAADKLDIPRHWLHRHAEHEHVDIPVRQIARVLADPRVTVVSSRDIFTITRALRVASFRLK